MPGWRECVLGEGGVTVYVALMITRTPDTIGLCLGSGGDAPCHKDCLLDIILLGTCKLHPHWSHCRLVFV